MISWPGRVWESTDTRFPMVPAATKSPASFPVRSAARAPPPRRGGVALHQGGEGWVAHAGGPLAGVDLGEEEEGLGHLQRPRKVLQDQLQPLADRDQVALGPVRVRHP